MKEKVNLKYIAKEFGVSISTVSKALKDSYEIGKETRERIQEYARQHNYRPNRIAQSLKDGRTKTIAVIIPEIVHHFFAEVISGVESIANKNDYTVIVCSSNDSFDKEVINMDTLANGKIDGFIISLAKETLKNKDYHHIQEVINQGMPVVMFDRVTADIDCDKVVVDDVEGAEKAIDFLIKKNRKNIGLISSPDYLSVGFHRTQGYINSMSKHQLPFRNSNILKIDDMMNCKAPIDAFISDNTFDAIFAVNEVFAITAMKILRKKGFEIPKDIEVIGFSNGILSKYSSPSLTSVDQHGEEMGKVAAQLLFKRLSEQLGDSPHQTQVINTSLKVRDSSPTHSS